MKRTCFILASLALMVSCSHTPNREQAIDSITAREQQLTRFSVGTNTEKANEIIDLYRQFATDFPEDSLAPVYLMRSADICLNLGENEQALDILDSLMAQYPGFEDIAGCLFLKGQAYENNEQYDLAREAYTRFVTEYPDHVLASDTRKMLPYIGFSPEEMLEAILASAGS